MKVLSVGSVTWVLCYKVSQTCEDPERNIGGRGGDRCKGREAGKGMCSHSMSGMPWRTRKGSLWKLPCPWGPGWIARPPSAAVRHEASSCHLVTISPRALNSALQLHQRPLACHTCLSFCQECFLPYSLPTAFASRVRPACRPADCLVRVLIAPSICHIMLKLIILLCLRSMLICAVYSFLVLCNIPLYGEIIMLWTFISNGCRDRAAVNILPPASWI